MIALFLDTVLHIFLKKTWQCNVPKLAFWTPYKHPLDNWYANPQLLLSCLVLQSTTTEEQKNHCSRVLLKAVGEGSLLPGSIQQTKQKKQELSQLSNICNKMFPCSLCSGRISAVGFPCDLWTSTRTTQKHMSGVRRHSVNKCLLHRYDDWSLGSQHLYLKKARYSCAHL